VWVEPTGVQVTRLQASVEGIDAVIITMPDGHRWVRLLGSSRDRVHGEVEQ
jgi:hypothetical protein